MAVQRRARRRKFNAQQRAANAESLSRQADRFRRALNQYGEEEPSFSHAPPRPDPWHPDPSAEPLQEYSSYRSRHAGEVDVAFLSTYDSDTLLQHYRQDSGYHSTQGAGQTLSQSFCPSPCSSVLLAFSHFLQQDDTCVPRSWLNSTWACKFIVHLYIMLTLTASYVYPASPVFCLQLFSSYIESLLSMFRKTIRTCMLCCPSLHCTCNVNSRCSRHCCVGTANPASDHPQVCHSESSKLGYCRSCREAVGDMEASAVPSAWAESMPDTPARIQPSRPPSAPVPAPLLQGPEALPGMNPEDWDEQARAEWTAFLRKSKMFQVATMQKDIACRRTYHEFPTLKQGTLPPCWKLCQSD